MKRQVNSENNDMDTQTSDSKHTWRRSGKHTRRKPGERDQQLDMISAPSTGRMSSVPTSALTSRMISATARAPERWCEDQASLIYAEWVQLCLPNGSAWGRRRMASWEIVETTTEKWRLSIVTKIMAEWLQIGIEYEDHRKPYLPKAPTGMFTKGLAELDPERPYWRAISLLGRCQWRMNITTDGHRVRATGCKGWSQIHQDWRLADQAVHEGLGERKCACIYMWDEWPFYEKLTR